MKARLGGALLAAVALTSLGCGASTEPAIEPALAARRPAQEVFRPIERAWLEGTAAERARLAGRLSAFEYQFSTDPLARLAKTWSAWIALDEGQTKRARALASEVARGAPGTTRDIARVIVGVALRHEGKPGEAFEVLSPLAGKLIDSYARELFDEEYVLTALEAHKPDDALRFMESWLREVEPADRERVRGNALVMMQSLPEETLLSLLERHRATGAESQTTSLAAERLAVLSQSRRDPELAKKLLDLAPTLLGDQGDAVARIAALHEAARLDARTVGLLLANIDEQPDTARRGAQVAAGLAVGLGLPGSEARLTFREARSDNVPDQLRALLADGASILVAGITPAQAAEAADFAETQRVPLLLLCPLADRSESPYVFILDGVAGRDAEAELSSAEPTLAEWTKAHHRSPTWYEALARDAGVIAWAALSTLKPENTSDPARIAVRRASTTQALAQASVALWTTGARGFDGGRAIAREGEASR